MSGIVQKTSGELLFERVRDRLIGRDPWARLAGRLSPVGDRAGLLAQYCEDLVALQTTGRLVRHAVGLAETNDPESPVFSRDIRDLFAAQFAVPFDIRDELFRFTRLAVVAARSHIRDGTRNALRQWARRRHGHCYLCRRLIDFGNDGDDDGFSLDHLWPRSFGGESEEWNLLPAHRRCNSQRGDDVDWAAIAIQALNVGLNPSPEGIGSISAAHRFALLFWAARQHAEVRQIGLRDALVQIGPQVGVARVTDGSDVADFYNLQIVRG